MRAAREQVPHPLRQRAEDVQVAGPRERGALQQREPEVRARRARRADRLAALGDDLLHELEAQVLLAAGTRLNLSANAIAEGAAQGLAQIIANGNLVDLDVRDTKLRGPAAKVVAAALGSKYSRVATLDLSWNGFHDEPGGPRAGGRGPLGELARALEHTATLTHVDLSHNLCANQIFNPTSMCAYANVLTRALSLCFENSTRAIDPSKNQPNRLRFDRARDF